MNLSSIKRHLKPYSVYSRRKTTINHAFASSLAPCDSYNEDRIAKAISSLGQDPYGDLTCVYCGSTAQTWDHLVSLVKDGQLQGYGHQVGNLVPSCRDCNSRKGNKAWSLFLEEAIPNQKKRRAVKDRLRRYLRLNAREVDVSLAEQRHRDKWRRYEELKTEIFQGMKEADKLAEILRLAVRKNAV